MIKLNPLTNDETKVIKGKRTEPAFSNQYWDKFDQGIYVCKQCGLPLFDSKAKFEAGCGWPSFDKAFPLAVKEILDNDGERSEIICARCGAHLGHVFRGEKLTKEDIRHCTNSLSLKFISASASEEYLNQSNNQLQSTTIVLGGGCFWCLEGAMRIIPGVLEVISGYSGGELGDSQHNPSYEEVVAGGTGFIEVVKITYDQATISLNQLLEKFLLIHDPTSLDKQGNDEGEQYRSVIFYKGSQEKVLIESFLREKQAGYPKLIVTEMRVLEEFYPAEEYHQRYFEKHPYAGYCQLVVRPKIEKIKQSLTNNQ